LGLGGEIAVKGFTFTGWVFFLILVYLLVSNGREVVSLVRELGGTALKGVVALQGRNIKGLTS